MRSQARLREPGQNVLESRARYRVALPAFTHRDLTDQVRPDGVYNAERRSIMAHLKKQPLLGEVELLVLLAVLRLADGAYAVPIRSLISKEAGVSLSRGTIYVTLERLEQKGYVYSWFSDPVAVRGGKARRHFQLKPLGMTALRGSRNAVDRLATGTPLARSARKFA